MRLYFQNDQGNKLANLTFEVSQKEQAAQKGKTNAKGVYLFDALSNENITIHCLEKTYTLQPTTSSGCFEDTIIVNTEAWEQALKPDDRTGINFWLDTNTQNTALVELRILNHTEKISGHPVEVMAYNIAQQTKHPGILAIPGVYHLYLKTPGKYELDFNDCIAPTVLNFSLQIKDTVIETHYVEPFFLTTTHGDTTYQSHPYHAPPATTHVLFEIHYAPNTTVWVKNDYNQYWKSKKQKDGNIYFYLDKGSTYHFWSGNSDTISVTTESLKCTQFQKKVLDLTPKN